MFKVSFEEFSSVVKKIAAKGSDIDIKRKGKRQLTNACTGWPGHPQETRRPQHKIAEGRDGKGTDSLWPST